MRLICAHVLQLGLSLLGALVLVRAIVLCGTVLALRNKNNYTPDRDRRTGQRSPTPLEERRRAYISCTLRCDRFRAIGRLAADEALPARLLRLLERSTCVRRSARCDAVLLDL